LQEAHPQDDDMAELHRSYGERRAAAYAQAAGSIRSDRFRTALLDIAEWVEIGPWTHLEDPDRLAERDRPAAEHAKRELRRLRKRIKAWGVEMDELSVSQLHKLRIRTKRLRYGTEFFSATFPGKKAAKRRDKSLEALKDLQDALGKLNDLAMRHDLVAGESSGHELIGYEAHADKLLDAAKDAHKRFVQAKAFWKV
jgi:CHAD domain-containing protein